MGVSSSFYTNQTEPNRSCLLALQDFLLDFDPGIEETTKYGMPCFVLKNKPFCYLWVDKKTKEPYILVVKGNEIEHPALEKGDRSRMKIFRINPVSDLPFSTISEVLQLALVFY